MRTRVFTLYVAAAPERVWTALTDAEQTPRFFHGLAVASTWLTGDPITYRSPGGPDGPGWASLAGEIVHVEPGRRLTYTLADASDDAPDPHCWITWTVAESMPGLCAVELICDDVDADDNAERDAAWAQVLAGLKATLETPRTLSA